MRYYDTVDGLLFVSGNFNNKFISNMEKLKGYLERKEGEIVGIASTNAVDRDGEVIEQGGWDLDNFKRNPVLLVSHNYQEFPVGKATDIQVADGKLVFRAVFSEATQKAKEAYALVKEGILSAFSVGFIPREYDTNESSIITKAELLEISLVPVPANPEAVVLAKSMKDNEIAKYIVKNFLADEPPVEIPIETIPETGEDTTAEVGNDKLNGQDGGQVEDTPEEVDLKLLQRTVGHLQELCRELKQKGGAKK